MRTTAPTGSSDAGGGAVSTRGRVSVDRPREGGGGLATPAAFRPGFALVRAAFGDRAGFAAGLLSASALDAAFAAVLAGVPALGRFGAPASRFVLRLPGRAFGRFPRTPPSSVMDGDSNSARSGYTAP